jgi:cytochrome c biogenesis protein CcmG, thiol:disulfide interchange protein DsbE
MKKIGLTLASLLLAGCSQSTTALPNDGVVVDCSSIQSVVTGKKAVDLDCLDEGSVIDLSSIKGPVLVNVWGSWCGPCKDEMPIFVDFYNKHSKSVGLIGISVEEADIQDARDFVQAYGMTWPNLYDAEGTTRASLGMGVPITLFIDENGEIVYRKIGVVTTIEELEDDSRKYLGVNL